jgi:lysozyme
MMAMTQTTSQRGRDLITQFEGLRLVAYRDVAGIWTIGYGHTGPDVVPGLRITKARALELLAQDLRRFERGVTQVVGQADQEHFDALVSLAYNIGLANFAKSSVVRWHNRGDEAKAANSFGLWVKARVKGKLTVVSGLVRRRAAEASMYREGDFADVHADKPIAMAQLSTAQIAAGVESPPESALKPETPGGLIDMAKSGRVVRTAITAPAAGGLAVSAIEAQDAAPASVTADAISGVEASLHQADAVGASVDPGVVAEHLDRVKGIAEQAHAVGGIDWKIISIVLAAVIVGVCLHAVYAAWTARTGDR